SKCQKFPQGQTVKPGPNQHLSQSQKFKTKKLAARSNRPSSREAAYKPHYAKWSTRVCQKTVVLASSDCFKKIFCRILFPLPGEGVGLSGHVVGFGP
ncbi:hypothetical protein, partial [Rhizobium paknamense]